MSERGNPWESPKILEKVSGLGSGVKASHCQVTCNIQIFYAVGVGAYQVFFLLVPAV